MNQLTKYLISEILDGQKVTAVFGGAFKPPTKGHFDVVKKALDNHKEIDKFIIYVGGGVRDGITQEQAIQIWQMYKELLGDKVEIIPSKNPIGDVKRYPKNNKKEKVYFVIGAREGREDDLADVAQRTAGVEETYPNTEVKVIPTQDGGMSGTNARKVLKSGNKEEFFTYLPEKVPASEKESIWDLLNDALVKEGDPEVGTGKKPKGSGRRLYTDEDPTDTVAIKFSSKQDIIDTLSKTSFKSKPHNRQSQIINVIHQRVRAVYERAKDPEVKARLKKALDYAEQRKEASKEKTQRLNKENVAPNHTDKAAPYGSGYKEVNEIGVKLSNYSGQVLAGDVVRAPKGFPLGGKKLEKSLELKVKKISREGVNRYKLSLEDSDGKNYTVRNYQMDGEYKGEKLPKWGLVRKSKENVNEKNGFGGQTRYRAIEKRGDKYYYIQDNPFAPGIRQEFGPYKTKEAAKKKMQSFPPSTNYRDITENTIPSIDIVQKCAELTQHMIDKGYNIQPLPSVKFIGDDSSNAEDFFGKTAYYDPGKKMIVLYTYGRHPKDIVRSFAHEMIHHMQNLEGRLGDVTTTDTTEDDRLNDLEKEANLKGTMTFRNWTDSLQERKNKDPFGLNQYARELAQGLEEKQVNENALANIIAKLAAPLISLVIGRAIDGLFGYIDDIKNIVAPEPYIKFLKGLEKNDEFNKQFIELAIQREKEKNPPLGNEWRELTTNLPAFKEAFDKFAEEEGIEGSNKSYLLSKVSITMWNTYLKTWKEIHQILKKKYPDLTQDLKEAK
jgi:hypothetical protein